MSKETERKNFCEEETEMLLEIFGDNAVQAKFKNIRKSHTHIWNQIADKLNAMGFCRTGGQCKDRIANLKKRYLEIRRNMRSGSSPPEWVYWEKLHIIYGLKPSAEPELLMDSFGVR